MHWAVLALLAALMGAASVELFGQAFKGLLGALAAWILFFRGQIDSQGLASRLSERLLAAAGCGAALTLCFRVYLQELALGESGMEQLFYFLACVWRMAVFIRHARAEVEAMFDCSD